MRRNRRRIKLALQYSYNKIMEWAMRQVWDRKGSSRRTDSRWRGNSHSWIRGTTSKIWRTSTKPAKSKHCQFKMGRRGLMEWQLRMAIPRTTPKISNNFWGLNFKIKMLWIWRRNRRGRSCIKASNWCNSCNKTSSNRWCKIQTLSSWRNLIRLRIRSGNN